jgi:uncharacterized protein (TIGR02594 family)
LEVTVIESVISALKAFFNFIVGKPIPRSPEKPDEQPSFGEPAVLKRARQDIGQHEIAGDEDNPVIMSYWRYVDYKPPDGDETAWCSAGMCAWHEEVGIPGTRQPNARSWERWGQKLKKPKPGCVAVEWRVSPNSWQGHVTLYVGPGSRPGTYMALGGNQSNQVCIQERPLSKVLCFREPLKSSNSRTLRAGTLGVLSAGMSGAVVLDSKEEIMGIIGVLKSLGASMPGLVLTTSIISIICFCIVVWARWQDFGAKGK